MNYTQTFLETHRYRQADGVCLDVAGSTSPGLDLQVKHWVDTTKNLIVHPGQPSVHQAWQPQGDNPYAIKVVTLALTVLYIPASEAQNVLERANAAAKSGAIVVPTGSLSAATPKKP